MLFSGKEYVCVVKLHDVVKESQFAKVTAAECVLMCVSLSFIAGAGHYGWGSVPASSAHQCCQATASCENHLRE